jgi:23S rRNA (pseudouridine1915-N3)-methyltransferase
MRITLMECGKTRDAFVREGVGLFRKRVERYVPFRIETLPDLKNTKSMTMQEVQEREALQMLRRIRPGDFLLLLDERGDHYNSITFAEYLNSMEGSVSHLVFAIGGPYGFAPSIYQRANAKLALSRLTFSHQLARLIFMEQLYRAFTILRGEPYHHQ